MQAVAPIRTEEYDLVCPITLRTFRDPVIAADGHTYEREAIVRWITEHGTSPLTRQPLNVNDLLSDSNLRDTIGRRPSLTASIYKNDEPMLYRSPRVTPINDAVLINNGKNIHVLREGGCCRRRYYILIMVLLVIFLLACGLTVGLLMKKSSAHIESKYSSELTTSNPTYCRGTCEKGNFYYVAITVCVATPGTYLFSSKSDIDTYGYIYTNSFNPSKPRRNLLQENNDSGEKKQFKLKVNLKSGPKYILVTTTSSPNVTGSFSIIASGPTSVSFPQTTILSTTKKTKTTTPKRTKTKTTRRTTTAANMPSMYYRSSLKPTNPMYCRPSKNCSVPNFYYQDIEVHVSMNGSYSIGSNSNIDTHVYIYNNSFNMSNPNQNLLAKGDDSSEEKQFQLKVFLYSESKYILVVTTKKPGKTGAFSVTAAGLGHITLV